MVAGDQFVKDGRAGESRAVAAHVHEFVRVGHSVCWVGDDNAGAAEEEGVDALAGGGHHCCFPVISGDWGHGYEVVVFDVGDCFGGEVVDYLWLREC